MKKEIREQLLLPRTYKDKQGKYPQHEGKPKGSYSQYTSYKDPLYQNDYYVQYFLGIDIPSGEFAEFGSGVGKWIETKAQGNPVQEVISDNDVKILEGIIDFPPNCLYEDHIVVDLGNVVIEGYVDRAEYDEDLVKIYDFKTGNLETKAEFYASGDYNQTTLYSYQKEQEGYEVVYSGVKLLGRKGNALESSGATGNYVMRLSGEFKDIPTPYTKERAEKLLEDMKKTFAKISEEYKIYKRIFENGNL